MIDTSYYALPFRRRGGKLVGEAPIRLGNYIAAIGAAQRLAQERAGAIVLARARDRDGRNVEIIFKTGEVPDGALRSANYDLTPVGTKHFEANCSDVQSNHSIMPSRDGTQSAMKAPPRCTACRGATRHYLHLVDPGTSRQRDLFRCETCGKHIWAGVAVESAAH